MDDSRIETVKPGKYGDVEIIGDTGPSGQEIPDTEIPVTRDFLMKGRLSANIDPELRAMEKGTAHWGEMDLEQSYGAHGKGNVIMIYGNRNPSLHRPGPRPGAWGSRDVRQYLESGGDPDLI